MNEAKTCRECGAPRPCGHSAYCAPCRTAGRRARYAERGARNACHGCGKPLQPGDAGRVRCEICRAKVSTRADRRKRCARIRRGDYSWMQGEPLPIGQSVNVRVVRELSVWLDYQSYTCFKILRRRVEEYRRQRCDEAGITDRSEIARHTSLLFETAALLRHLIKTYHATYRHLPRSGYNFQSHGFRVNFRFGADAQTLRIVLEYAADRGGNISAALRDLLCYAAYPERRIWES